MKLLLFVLITLSFNTHSNEKGNGGGACDNRIQTLTKDIKKWISTGGGEQVNLPDNHTPTSYKKLMLKSIKNANSKKGSVGCTNERLFVGETEKTCKNYPAQSIIECNFNRFMDTNEDEQYKLVHHEYAGLAGIEINEGEISNYYVSEQLSAQLEYVVVRRIPIVKEDYSSSTIGGNTDNRSAHDVLYNAYVGEDFRSAIERLSLRLKILND